MECMAERAETKRTQPSDEPNSGDETKVKKNVSVKRAKSAVRFWSDEKKEILKWTCFNYFNPFSCFRQHIKQTN